VRANLRRIRVGRHQLALAVLWLGAGAGLAVVTTRVRDWFAMTNELLNERRAINVAQTFSPWPTVHREVVGSFDQLYPLLIAPVFLHGGVLADLRDAHALNAFVMTSACVPAYLLARRLGLPFGLALAAAALAICTPWIFFASFLLNEVIAFPVFLWTVFAIERTLVAPSRCRDAVVLALLGLAFFARTQLVVVAVALPVALVAYEVGRDQAAGLIAVRPGLRAAVSRHRVLAVAYGALGAVAVGLLLFGRLGHAFGVYGGTITGNILPHGIPRSFVWHVATLSLGVGILPLIVGLAWMLTTLARPHDADRHAFACISTVLVVFILLQVTTFDLRYVDQLVLDRYLIYLAPLALIGFLCALDEGTRLRLSLGVMGACVIAGFAAGAIPPTPIANVNSDAPMGTFFPPIVSWAGSVPKARLLLVGATLLLTAAFVAGGVLLPRRRFAVVFTVLPLVFTSYLTFALFDHFFTRDGWASRPLTIGSGSGYDWIDQRLGAGADVAIVPYPVSSAYLVSQRVWRDYEFWNKSVDRDIQLSSPGIFRYTNETFPKLYPRFDPSSGRANMALGPYVVQSDQETRARISGTVAVQMPDVMLIRTNQPPRADWISLGLYDDGWTRPGKIARIRVFALPGATVAELRTLTVGIRGPEDNRTRPVTINSNHTRWHGSVSAETTLATLTICVPPHGYAEARLRAPEREVVPGDLRDWNTSDETRLGGVFVNEISLADEVGPHCRP
jgi:hypothetical protein